MLPPNVHEASTTPSLSERHEEAGNPEFLMYVQEFVALSEDYAIVKFDTESFIKAHGEHDVTTFLQQRVPTVPPSTIRHLLPAVASLAAGIAPLDSESFTKAHGKHTLEAYFHQRVPTVPASTILRLMPALASLAAGVDQVAEPDGDCA